MANLDELSGHELGWLAKLAHERRIERGLADKEAFWKYLKKSREGLFTAGQLKERPPSDDGWYMNMAAKPQQQERPFWLHVVETDLLANLDERDVEDLIQLAKKGAKDQKERYKEGKKAKSTDEVLPRFCFEPGRQRKAMEKFIGEYVIFRRVGTERFLGALMRVTKAEANGGPLRFETKGNPHANDHRMLSGVLFEPDGHRDTIWTLGMSPGEADLRMSILYPVPKLDDPKVFDLKGIRLASKQGDIPRAYRVWCSRLPATIDADSKADLENKFDFSDMRDLESKGIVGATYIANWLRTVEDVPITHDDDPRPPRLAD